MAAKLFWQEGLSEDLASWIRRWADRIIWALIACYVVSFSWLTWQKYFAFGYYDWDFASDVIVLWNSVHGRFLYYPFLEQTIFGAHLYLIVFLLIPLFALFQSPLFLLFFQSLFLGLAAFPLYLFASSKLDKEIALAVCAVYLLYPSVGFINLFETHFEIYAIFFLFFAFYFFEKERFRGFLYFLILALACKENVSFVVFMFGVYAWMRRRPWKWAVFPAVLGVVWFVVAVKLVIPYFAKDARLYQDGFIFSIYYQHLGKTIGEMARTIVLHPAAMLKYAFGGGKADYLFNLLVPTGFLGLLSPLAMVLTLPVLAQNLLSSAWSHSQIQYQYVASMIPPIFISVVFGLKRLAAQPQFQRHRGALLFVFLACPVVWGKIAGAPQLHFPAYARAYRIDDLARRKAGFVRAIPPQASVMATFQFLPHLARRHDLYSLHLVSTGYRMYTKTKYVPPPNLEYALIDFNEPLMIGSFFPHEAPLHIRAFLEDGGFRVQEAAGDVVLFKKNTAAGHKLCEFIGEAEPEFLVGVAVNQELRFLGYDAAPVAGDGRLLHFVLYWQRLKTPAGQRGFFVHLLDADGRLVMTAAHPLGYRIYPSQDWPENRILREHYYFFLPQTAKGRYDIRCGIFSLEDAGVVPFEKSPSTDSSGRISLGSISVN